jgi:hypothetical protein
VGFIVSREAIRSWLRKFGRAYFPDLAAAAKAAWGQAGLATLGGAARANSISSSFAFVGSFEFFGEVSFVSDFVVSNLREC